MRDETSKFWILVAVVLTAAVLIGWGTALKQARLTAMDADYTAIGAAQ